MAELDLSVADPRCKTCYGTGVYAHRIHADRTKEKLICSCVANAMAKKGICGQCLGQKVVREKTGYRNDVRCNRCLGTGKEPSP